jgi:REP element-mobilizing transposase RayT
MDPSGVYNVGQNGMERRLPRDPEWHQRRSLRAKWLDYSSGQYFVTICTYDRACLLGHVVSGAVSLGDAGRIVNQHWRETPEIRPYVTLDAFVIMPNHLHGIIIVSPHETGVGISTTTTGPRGTRPGSLGAVIQQFKGVTTRRINMLRGVSGTPVWQRNYYEHVIRDADDLARIRAYIAANPSRWEADQHHPNDQYDYPNVGANR